MREKKSTLTSYRCQFIALLLTEKKSKTVRIRTDRSDLGVGAKTIISKNIRRPRDPDERLRTKNKI